MDRRLRLYADIVAALDHFSRRPLFFRGHASADWTLTPTIGRINDRDDDQRTNEERIAFDEFLGRGGNLVEEHDSWDTATTMQHHGLPTRLLDWTATFAIALHFALRSHQTEDCAIWILDPIELNRRTIGTAALIRPASMPASYSDYFLTRRSQCPAVVALTPHRRQPRVFAQHSGFTLHGELRKPLDEIYPELVRKILIPASERPAALALLDLTGVSEFALFPDLDGLAREVRTHLRW